MTTFTDANGRVWRLKLTMEAIDRINGIINQGREGPPLDLLEIADEEGRFCIDAFQAIFVSPRRMQSVLSQTIQWDAGSGEEGRALGNGLRDGAIEAAFAALFDELSYFFPESQRPVVQQMLASYRSTARQMGELAAGMLRNTLNETLQGIASPADAGS